MSIGQALFSFSGRLSRRDYWLKGALVLLPFGILVNILRLANNDNDTIKTLGIIIGVISLWPAIALIVKRLHDHGRSGWFAATLLIPIADIVFAIWIIALVWFIKGNAGPNKFGDDPESTIPKENAGDSRDAITP